MYSYDYSYGYSSAADKALGWIIFGVICAVVLQIVFCVIMGRASANKGYSFAGGFWSTFFFGVFGATYVAALPDLVAREMARKVNKKIIQEALHLKKEIQNLTNQLNAFKKEEE